MKNETPRTDYQVRQMMLSNQSLCAESLKNWAIQLERELNESDLLINQLVRELKIELERSTHYRDKWQNNEAYIKRLEEAGDKMERWIHRWTKSPIKCANDWRKAKEAKP